MSAFDSISTFISSDVEEEPTKAVLPSAAVELQEAHKCTEQASNSDQSALLISLAKALSEARQAPPVVNVEAPIINMNRPSQWNVDVRRSGGQIIGMTITAFEQ